MLAVTEAGGEDLESTGEEWVVTTGPTDAMQVKGALEAQGLPVKGAELVMEPVNETIVTPQDASKVLRLVDQLEEHDDIQNVYHTMAFTDEIAASLGE
ncbi:MAG: YebC/PmpR family DNA-binding transcriptional regulator, partial [Coriobacteriia bacterium]|jgi:transcriptional/translational regulatory protein YebC/TACO1|nr:YebC/PmpR family DNA-binding transcriptional regulator [Coriobacteriia bacterium]